MENDLLKVANEIRIVTPQDVIDFNEATQPNIGYTYTPVAVISEYNNIGTISKDYLVIGKVASPGATPEILILTIRKVVSPVAKWTKVNKVSVLMNEDINLEDLAIDLIKFKSLNEEDLKSFELEYPSKLGVSQTPICKIHIGKEIGGYNFYLVKNTIISPPFTSNFTLLESKYY